MITGIEAIGSENQSAVQYDLALLELSLSGLEENIRGLKNTTVIDDRKTRVNPPTLEESLIIITPQEQSKLLQDSRQLSQLKEGSFKINNTVITVDPARETFVDIVNKINASADGIIARYDPIRNRFDVKSKDEDKVISFTKDTSNFLLEVNIKQGSYLVTTDAPMFRINNNGRTVPNILSGIDNLNRELNNILNNELISDEIKDTFKNDLIDTISQNMVIHPDSSRFFLEWGLEVNFHPDITNTVTTVRNEVIKQLQSDLLPVVRFFSGDSTDVGFIQRAYESITEINKQSVDTTA